ncbi:MAG: fibronectin type III domain-containing protein [Ignavibacteria bacterium]
MIYAGGLFTNVGGQTRNRLAAIDTSGNILSWDPNSGGMVNSLVIKDSIIFVGGSFFNISGITRQRLAAIDKNGNLLDWVFNANGTVNKIGIVDKYFYASGNFTTINGISRKRFVAVDLNSNTLRDFQVSLDLSSYDFEFDPENGIIFLGGAFNSVNDQIRTGLAAIYDPQIIPPSRPNAPSNLSAIPDTFSVYLSWSDNSNNETGFILERKDDSLHIPGVWTVIATLPENTTSFIDTGLIPNTTYS